MGEESAAARMATAGRRLLELTRRRENALLYRPIDGMNCADHQELTAREELAAAIREYEEGLCGTKNYTDCNRL